MTPKPSFPPMKPLRPEPESRPQAEVEEEARFAQRYDLDIAHLDDCA
jgi:hypothetical protein